MSLLLLLRLLILQRYFLEELFDGFSFSLSLPAEPLRCTVFSYLFFEAHGQLLGFLK